MNGFFHQETAKIYQFPPQSRAALGASRTQAKNIVTPASRQVPVAMSFDSWYHEAAIQDAERSRKP